MGRLFIRVIHRRKHKQIDTEYRLYAEEWDACCQRVTFTGAHPLRSEELSRMQESIEKDLERLKGIVEMFFRHGEYTAQDVRAEFVRSHRCGTLLAFTGKLVADLTDNEQYRTARAYLSAARSLVQFNGGRDLPLGEIRAAAIRSYERYLFDKGLQMNTVSFYMRNLRAIYYKAVRAGLIVASAENPFEHVFTGVHATRRRSLNGREMKALSRLENKLTGQAVLSYLKGGQARSLQESLFYFLFAYHARGMSFIDLAHLRKSDLGQDTLIYKRKKTGAYLEVRITGPMRKIIRYFGKQTRGSAYVFPIVAAGCEPVRAQYETALTNQNRNLKILAAMAGISRTVSTHVARHTWATLAKRMGFSISLISEGLGHRDTKITSIYLASFERSAMDHLSTRLSGAVKAA